MTVLPLVFDAPKRGLPPQHLADLDLAGRKAAVVALGEKAFRAEQLSPLLVRRARRSRR